jgi:hypothetical protein
LESIILFITNKLIGVEMYWRKENLVLFAPGLKLVIEHIYHGNIFHKTLEQT